VHEVQKVAVRVAVSEGHCRPAAADSHADVPVGQHHLRRAAGIGQVGRLDIGSVGNPARVQGTFDAHDLVGAMLAVDHGDRAEEALPADVLFAQVAEADPCLADMPPLGVVDPGTHGSPFREVARSIVAVAPARVLPNGHSRRSHTAGCPFGADC